MTETTSFDEPKVGTVPEDDNDILTKKTVSFDEDPDILTFERVSPQDRARLWFPREHFRLNRMRQQEETMMETIRGLVKGKLVEEATVSKTAMEDPTILAQRLEEQLEDIMSRTKPEILEFLQAKFNWITDSNDYWKDLPPLIQKAASVLGYTPELWDESSQSLPVFDKNWASLAPHQQQAAQVLGYNEMTWNGSLESSVSTPMEEDEAPIAVTRIPAEPRGADEPMFDWNDDAGNTASSSSSSDDDNDNEDTNRMIRGETYDNNSSSSDSQDDTPVNIGIQIPSNTLDTEYEWGEDENDDDEAWAAEVVGSSDNGNDTTENDKASLSRPSNDVEHQEESSLSLPTTQELYMNLNPTIPKFDTDADADEFIANFLSPDVVAGSAVATSPIHTSRRLSDRYVPSDDEFDLDLNNEGSDNMEGKDDDESPMQSAEEANGLETEPLVASSSSSYPPESTKPKSSFYYSSKNEDLDGGESTPLLDSNGAPKLVRRWQSGQGQGMESTGANRSIPLGDSSKDNDDDDEDDNVRDDDSAERVPKPRRRGWVPIISMAISGLALIWIVARIRNR